MAGIPLVRSAHRLRPDPRRVLARPYSPGEEVQANGVSRAALLMERVLRLPEEDMGTLLSEVMARFAHRHHAFEDLLEKHFELVAHVVASTEPLSRERRLLIGAYFTCEYSVEAAALFNPSIVLAADQNDLGAGEQRFVMSMRAVGGGISRRSSFAPASSQPKESSCSRRQAPSW